MLYVRHSIHRNWKLYFETSFDTIIQESETENLKQNDIINKIKDLFFPFIEDKNPF